jgi:DNA polymerase III subunit alpha
MISNSSFVHSHCHSEMSQFDGLCSVQSLVMQARKMGFPAIALTDHGNMGGAIKFIQECKAIKDKNDKEIPYPIIKPILGIEAYFCKDRHAHDNKTQLDERKGNYHLILLAQNWAGYQNLCSLSHKAFSEGFYHDPRIDFDLLSQYSEGLICQTACLKGIIARNLLYNRYDQAKKVCQIFKDIFGDRFFIEMMYHGITAESQIIPDMMKLASELDIPLVCSNDVHYLDRAQSKSQEVLMCMSTQTCLSNPGHIRHEYSEFYMKSAEEMYKMFKFCPQAITNTLAVADMIDTKDIERNMFGKMRLPSFVVPEGFSGPYEYMEKLAWDGMKRLGWDKSEPHVEALKKELEDVRVAKESNDYDFATYFLIVRDYINFCREKKILTAPGRGSGYASILLRCLRICYGVDPISNGLLWERFLGFQNSRFLSERDFGFVSIKTMTDLADNNEDIDELGEYMEDPGGVNRY